MFHTSSSEVGEIVAEILGRTNERIQARSLPEQMLEYWQVLEQSLQPDSQPIPLAMDEEPELTSSAYKKFDIANCYASEKPSIELIQPPLGESPAKPQRLRYKTEHEPPISRMASMKQKLKAQYILNRPIASTSMAVRHRVLPKLPARN